MSRNCRNFHFVYKTTCSITGKYYIGLHSSDTLDDDYLGSGWKLRRSVKKYGKENHNRILINLFPDRTSAALAEYEIITPEILNDPLCLNLRSGGTGNYPGTICKTEIKEKLSGIMKIRHLKQNNILNTQINEDIKNFFLTGEEIIEILISKNNTLNKNAVRELTSPRIISEASLSRRARMNKAKWDFIRNILNEIKFAESIPEQIYGYINKLVQKPKCKCCNNYLKFYRFNNPYGIYCSNKCQLLDKDFKNPVLSRWKVS